MDRWCTGKTLLITGAGGSFGRAGALHFAARGASLLLFDIAEGPLKETAKLVKEAGAEAYFGQAVHVVVCDVTDHAAVDAAVQEGCSVLGGPIHLCWNNAGYQGQMTAMPDYDALDFKRVMDINVLGIFNVLQSVSKTMRGVVKEGASRDELEAPGFSIVNTASVAGLRGTPTMCAYVSSKAAVMALTMTAAKDLAPLGIRINAVSPALIGPGFMWDRQNELHHASGSPYFAAESPAELGAKKVGGVPMKRLGAAEEVCKTVEFLLSTQSSYTTGTNLIVDGGMAMR